MATRFTSLDICAGAGGQSLGLERAGFDPVLLLDNDADACASLTANRPFWDVKQDDLVDFVGHEHPQVLDVDLMAGGLPRLPYSSAGKQQPASSEREDLFKAAIWLATEIRPRVVMLENLPQLAEHDRFADTRAFAEEELGHSGYECSWHVLDAQDFGIPQRRKHGVLVAMAPELAEHFSWPAPTGPAPTVGEALEETMAARGWPHAERWSRQADEVAPTVIGGSKDRGGADLGPTRSKNIWARLGVNGSSIANEVPGPDFVFIPEDDRHGRGGLPKLTVEQVALLQGFPSDWRVEGRKTSRYRQVGHAFPPPLAHALGRSLAETLARSMWPDHARVSQ